MGLTNLNFILVFLPVVFILYHFAAQRYKNLLLLISSITFLALQQAFYLPFFITFILVNFFLGRWIGKKSQDNKKNYPLIAAITINIVLLAAFKFFSIHYSNIFDNPFLVNLLGSDTNTNSWIMPLGFSFIVFQVISYFIDISNGICRSEKNILNFSNYVLLFPKLISGPIERYRNMNDQLIQRDESPDKIAHGIRRFILGLAKKVLIADTIAQFVNPIFNLSNPHIPSYLAWFILVGYTIQIYFDFSGYTDMALGLGDMFGFRFTENFNFPYISRSVTEFWRRWHISLSSWFRDYIFIPTEFARRRSKFFTQQMTIVLVFVLTGVWHGFTLNFLIWGALFGLAIALESSRFGKWLKHAWRPLQHLWTMVWVMFGWIFFRSPNLAFAKDFFKCLIGAQPSTVYPFSMTNPYPIIQNSVWIALVFGIVFSLPVSAFVKKILKPLFDNPHTFEVPIRIAEDLILMVLLLASIASITSSSYIPYIYASF